MEDFFSQIFGNWNANIETLAKQKSDCDYFRYTKRCSSEECRNCSTGQKLQICYSQLPLCDQLKVNQIAKEKTGWKIYDFKRELKRNRNSKILIGIILGFFVVIPCLAGLLFGAHLITAIIIGVSFLVFPFAAIPFYFD